MADPTRSRASKYAGQGGFDTVKDVWANFGTQGSPTYRAQPEGTWGPSRAINAMLGDAMLMGLGGASGAVAGGAGLVGDTAEYFGMEPGSADRLGRDLAAMGTEMPWNELGAFAPTLGAGAGRAASQAAAFVPDEFGGVPVPDTLTKWITPENPRYVSDGSEHSQAWWDANQITPPGPRAPVPTMNHPDQTAMDLGYLDDEEDPVLSAIKGMMGTDPEVKLVLNLLDEGNGRAVTPELFEAARMADPDGLAAALAARQPPDLAGDLPATLGMTDRVYHYTEARGNVPRPGSAPFGYFDPDRGGFNQTFDSLGPHVGTHAAADTRRSAKGANIDWYFNPDETGITSSVPDDFNDYEWDAHPQGKSDMIGIPGRGHMLELAADLSKPFTTDEARSLIAKFGWGGPDDQGTLLPMDVTHGDKGADWTENNINRMLNALISRVAEPGSRTDRIADVRRFLAKEGYTNVPYVNEIEDPGSMSHVMLTDRPAGSKAVLRDRRAAFHPALSHLPNLTAGVAGAATLGGTLAGDKPEQ